MVMKKMDDNKSYISFTTSINKNGSHQKRVCFVNHEVTKYFLHYVLCFYPIRFHAMANLHLDQRLFNSWHIAVDGEFDTMGGMENEYVERNITTRQFLKTYLFACTSDCRGENVVTSGVTRRCSDMLIGYCGQGYSSSSW